MLRRVGKLGSIGKWTTEAPIENNLLLNTKSMGRTA